MLHKAFLLNYAGFESELKLILEDALADGDCATLIQFVRENSAVLKDPDEAEPLADDWESSIENADAHEYGDIALTKFYDPDADIGLGDEWDAVQEQVSAAGLGRSPILGRTIGREPFDPGRMGAYFQSAEDVCRSLAELEALVENDDSDGGRAAVEMLKRAAGAGAGLYVTF